MDNIVPVEPHEAHAVIPLVDLVAGYIEARDQIKKFDEEYDKNVNLLKLLTPV